MTTYALDQAPSTLILHMSSPSRYFASRFTAATSISRDSLLLAALLSPLLAASSLAPPNPSSGGIDIPDTLNVARAHRRQVGMSTKDKGHDRKAHVRDTIGLSQFCRSRTGLRRLCKHA